MYDWITLHVGALAVTGTLFGIMAGFAFLFTPLVFRYTDREDAANLMRKVFPVYYRVLASVSVVPAIFLIPAHAYSVEVVTMLAVAVLFIVAARFIVPALEKARAAGDEPRRARLHRGSVILHLAQMIAVLVIFIRLAA